MYKKILNKFNKLTEDNFIKVIFLLLILFLILFFIYNCDISLWADEFFSIERTKKNISFFNVILNSSLLDSWPPLFYILLHCFQLLFDNSEIILRGFVFIFSISSLFILYSFTKLLYSKKEAILTCILFTFSPYILSYSIEIRGYSLFLLLSILSSQLLILFIKKEKNSYLFLFFLFSLLLSLTHYFGLILTLFQFLYLLFEKHNAFNRKNIFLFILFLVLLLIYPAIHFNNLYFKNEIFKHNAIFASTIINRNTFILKELFPQMLFNIINIKIEILFIFISILFLFYNKKNKSNQFILFFIFAPLLSVNLFAYFFMSFLHVRYFIFLFPLVYIMISHFIAAISKNYFYVILFVLLLLFCLNIPKMNINFSSHNDKENILLLKNFSKDKIIVLHSKLYFVNYYLDKYNIKNYPINDIIPKDFKTDEICDLIKEYKYIFFIYPFMQEDQKYNYLFEEKFKMIEITPKLYCLSEK